MDYLQLHKDKKAELADLYTRMKDDSEFITNVQYVVRDAKKVEIDGMVGVIGNRPTVFATFVEAALNRADEKVYVESDDEKIDTAEIEDAIKRMFQQANSRRRKESLPNIEPYLDQQNCRRGRSMARLVAQPLKDDNGKPYLAIDIALWDTRYVTCEPGVKGWGAYEITKTKGVIESEAWAIKTGFELKGSAKSALTIDIWTPEGNLIYVGGELVFEQEHPYGFPPLVYQIVPVGQMLADDNSVQHEGESIFFMCRHLIPEFNRAVSILQTENMNAVKGATQQAVKDPSNPAEVADYTEANAMGSNTGVIVPNAITPIQRAKSYESMVLMLRELSKMIDDATLSPIMLGNLPGPMSAVALVQIEQGQGQVYMPRLGNRGLTKQALAEMFFAEVKAYGLSTIELGAKGHKKSFKTSKFDGEYDITFSYANKSPETDYARLAMAKQWKGTIDDLTILSDILKRDDPEGDLNRLRRQELRTLSPTLVIYDGLMALADLYEDGDESIADEIDIVEAELGVNLDQIKAGILPQSAGQKQPSEKMDLPMVTNTGQSSAQKASDLIRTPQPSIEGE